jgi:hypothetical protein
MPISQLRKKNIPFLLCLGSSLTACAGGPMIQSRSSPSTDPVQGVQYFLPKAVVPITISGSDGSTAADQGAATAKGSSTPSTGSSGAGPSSASATPQSASATAMASPQVNVTVNAAAAAAPAKAAQATPKTYKMTMTVGTPKMIADPGKELFLEYTEDPFADDTLGLHTQDGLLETAKGQAVDESANVGAALVQLAAVAAGFPGDVPLAAEKIKAAKPSPKAKCALEPVTGSVNFEPMSEATPSSLDIAGQKPLCSAGGCTWKLGENSRDTDPDFAMDGDQYVSATITATNSKPLSQEGKDKNTAAESDAKGVVFRRLVPWTITVTLAPSAEAREACHLQTTTHSEQMLLPNESGEFVEDMNRTPLISRQVGLTVKDGLLVGVDEVRPSTALAFVKLPLTIIQPIVSLPFTALTSGSSASGGASSSSSKNPTSGN